MAAKQPQYNYGTGRRKSAVARVYIKPGKGEITVNDKPVDVFFSRETGRMIVRQPLELIEMVDQFDVTVNVRGSGTAAQAEAVRHGIAKALCLYNHDLRITLKRAGLLTRDARVKERKKFGLKRARRAPQFSKR